MAMLRFFMVVWGMHCTVAYFYSNAWGYRPGVGFAHSLARGGGYNVCALKVSHACTEPVLMPVVNQRTRWALEPWVKLSGTT